MVACYEKGAKPIPQVGALAARALDGDAFAFELELNPAEVFTEVRHPGLAAPTETAEFLLADRDRN